MCGELEAVVAGEFGVAGGREVRDVDGVGHREAFAAVYLAG